MTAQADPYVRVYYRIADDPRFESVYGADAALAAWLRLLILADAVYPASAPLPGNIRKSALRLLTDSGLIELVSGGRYRVHGLSAEREKRAESARTANRVRWDSERSRGGLREPSTPSRAEPSHSEPIRAEPTRARAGGELTPLREAMTAAGLDPKVMG